MSTGPRLIAGSGVFGCRVVPVCEQLVQEAVEHLLDVLEGVSAQVVGPARLPQLAVLQPLGLRLLGPLTPSGRGGETGGKSRHMFSLISFMLFF